MPEPAHSLSARWIYPVIGPPIPHGTLEVEAGRIVRLRRQAPPNSRQLGNVALIPGLVNAHTHLEFSTLAAPFPASDSFADWIRQVVNWRRSQTAPPAAAIQQGLAESLRAGTTLLGEIATAGWTGADYQGAAVPRTVIFQESLSLDPNRIAELTEVAQHHLAESNPAIGGPTRGLSPHAPYTVHPALFEELIALANETHDTPCAMHLAESLEELELLAADQGPLRRLLEDFGVWRDGLFGRRSVAEFVHRLIELPRPLLIHGNFLSDELVFLLAQHPHATLVYCPRTHAHFGHDRQPWLQLLQLGGSVAIGTDSRASNPDLSLFRELQFLAERHPEFPQTDLLRLGTYEGARALGWAKHVGSLTAGKLADIAVVRLADPEEPDPDRALLHPGNTIVGTLLGGEWVHDPDGLATNA